MRFVASRLQFNTHLACVEIILDGVSIAHLIILILRVTIYLPEQAVGRHDPVVVHPHGAALVGLHFPTADATAAQDRQPITRVRLILQQQYSTPVMKRSTVFEHNNRK